MGAEQVQARLLAWYAEHARPLPWRRTSDPYAVLVAEVMLQQTQVERVIPAWFAWLDQFPTLAALAAASRADVIRAWQGLGYNLRAVRLHALAGEVGDRFGGQLPADVEALLTLKGIGRYTAGAVACFGFRQPVAMVDTNIRRVLARVFLGYDERDARRLQPLAEQVLPRHAAYAWNQALMDLGATVCRAERPLCLVCPLLELCVARGRPDPLQGHARRRPATPRFDQTDRYARGRIVAALRRLAPGTALTRANLARLLPDRVPATLDALVLRLAHDGLVHLSPSGIRLPD